MTQSASRPFTINVQRASGFPRIATVRIGWRNYAESSAEGAQERAAIALADVVTLGLFANGPWDRGDAGYLSRSDVISDIKARNPDIYVFDYTDVMEKRETGNQPLIDALDNGVGPTGNGGTWTPNDWWVRRAGTSAAGDPPGSKISTFPNVFNTNITDYVQPDATGRRYPEVYRDYTQLHHIDPVALGAGPQGVNIYCDVYDIRPRTNSTDMNRDGTSDRARTEYANPAHLGSTIASKWRQGQANYVNGIRSQNPGMLTIGNVTTWSREYRSVNEADAPALFAEYVGTLFGGQQEGQSLRSGFPFSNILSDGTNNPATPFGSWQLAQNAYTYVLDNTLDPKLVINDWHIDLFPSVPDTPLGLRRYTSNPQAPSVFHLFRWGLCSTLMDDGYMQVRTEPGGYASTPHFDEYGTVNQATTGLNKGWLGQPIDPTQRSPWDGSLYKREFDRGLAIVNTDGTGTNPAATVNVTGAGGIGAGIWKRITGSQDPSFNDGSTVNADFQLNPIDGIVLQRV